MSGANTKKYVNEVKELNKKVDDFVGEGGSAQVLQDHQIAMEYKIDALLGVLTLNVFKLLWFLLLPNRMKKKYIIAVGSKMMAEDQKAQEELRHQEKTERMQVAGLAKNIHESKKIPKRLQVKEGGKKDD